MGGAIALATALKHPDRVRRLVLSVTAGGVDVGALGAADWRGAYRSHGSSPSSASTSQTRSSQPFTSGLGG